ncbi:DnaJ sub B member 2 [Mortierella antarctica]|nr:DnaJ sub B member 2 [Mortierella antarctica]
MASDGEAPNYYELLCVEPNATKDDIRKAYRRQALLFHPDKMKPHMQDEASQHFQLISEAYEVLSDDKKRDLYDRHGYEGVKAGGDPNPPPAPDPFMNMHTQRQASGFGFGFDSPFFSAFGMPAHHQHFHDQAFAGHHQRHMRNMEQHMGSMFEPFGGFAQPPPSMFRDDPFFNRGFDMPHTAKPTLFSTSPFASEWTGSGTSTNPLTNFGGGFTSSSSSSSSFGGGGGARTSTRTTIVNGLRTTVTEVTDEHGVTRKTVDKPDGTREVYVNGVPAAIEGGAAQASAAQDGNRQEPIVIEDDDPQHLYHPRMGRGHSTYTHHPKTT